MSDEILTPEEGTEEKVEITPEADPEIETPQTPVEQPEVKTEGEEIEQPPPQEPDWKKKATSQGQENILLNARLENERTRIAALTSKDAPTDDEMRSAYSNWDELDAGSQAFYRNQREVEKRIARTEQLVMTSNQRLEFEDKLDDFTESPPDEFKGLKGQEPAFKRFAKRKDNAGLPLKILAQAFLFEAQTDAEPVHVPVKTPGLENGSGGPRTAPTHKKISIEEATAIRKTDWKRYKELLDSGQIEEFEG